MDPASTRWPNCHAGPTCTPWCLCVRRPAWDHDRLYLAMFLQPEPEPELPAVLPASQPEPQQLWVVVPPDAAGGTGGDLER